MYTRPDNVKNSLCSAVQTAETYHITFHKINQLPHSHHSQHAENSSRNSQYNHRDSYVIIFTCTGEKLNFPTTPGKS
jgi:hypothetical protein